MKLIDIPKSGEFTNEIIATALAGKLVRVARDEVVTRTEHTLVTTGPYWYVRHPFYLSFLIAVIGGSIVTANWYLFLSSLLPFAFLVVRTRIEEEKLVERFGDEYREYMAGTGRFVPRRWR